MAILNSKKGHFKKHVQKVRTIITDPSGSIAQEIYRKNVELAHTNQTLSLLRTIDGLVLEPDNSLNKLAEGIAFALVENSNNLFSAVFIKSTQSTEAPLRVGGYGIANINGFKMPDSDLVSKVRLYSDDSWFQSKDLTVLIDLLKKDKTLLNTFKEQAEGLKVFSEEIGCKTICLIKLMARRKLVGILLVGLAGQPLSIKVTEVEQLSRIGEAAGIAIDNKLLFEENQNVLEKLKLSNEKLKALDEAKDEFISMASHQLRTPLTSVKGYVSMVLEGDAGKISAQQKQLLEQAFTSSQRMVYLIADLLNVSRLRTGKFVIEAKPTNLPDVVEGEMQQLKESAKAHNLELTFNKPDIFPTLNLDETKTRQVIMNFMDNAIYYTPAGGHIRVELIAKDKTVEYKVIDDGLGVPKAEQHLLFTKFFRAGNAKKARPDGTGLGLFMAKKVIVAQGGSLIFESQEGKGSTFGFSFPRVGTEVKAGEQEKQ